MNPPRIASLLSSATEILYALGLGDQVVAVSHECDYPPAIHELPRVTKSRVDACASSGEIDRQVKELSSGGGAIYEVDAGKLAELRPDLIVTQSQCDVCAVSLDEVQRAVRETPGLERAAIVALEPRTLDGILDDILRVGRAAGVEQRAVELVAGLQGRIDAVAARSAAAAERPRTACVEWIEPLMLGANWMPELVELAGGEAGLVEGGRPSGYTAWEALREYDPQVVLVMPCGFDLARTVQEAPALGRLEGWSGLAAVRAARVFAADGNAYFNRSGPRMIDSLELLAHLVHPELHPAPVDVGAWQRLEW